ncbi:MAG: cysteine hydrolase [Deltaproteobacteria bacterium]|nr:cysteine hydrolase [Deltaproteobacteria bacterium]
MVRTEYVTARSLARAAKRWRAALRPWARRKPLPDLRRAALLVVDLEHAFADPRGDAFLPAAAAVLPRVLALRDAFRAAGLPVAFTRHAHRPDECGGSMSRHWRWLIRERTAQARLIPELAPRRGEPVFRKAQYSAFRRTGLARWLRRHHTGTLVVAGVMTHLCVETTAREAFVRELDVVVPLDATASSDETLHLGALRALANGFASVPPTSTLLRLLHATPHT